MAIETPEIKNAKTTFELMSHVKSRYLKPKFGSCHDRCKHGMTDESELKKSTSLGVRKILVKKNKLKRSVEPVEIKKFTKTKPKPKPSSSPKIKRENSLTSRRIGVSVFGVLTNRKSTQNEVNLGKNNVKAKSVSSTNNNGHKNKKGSKNIKNTGIASKSNLVEQEDEQSMTKTEFKQLITEKITEMTEMTLQEAENAELDLVPLTVEIESPLKDERNITKTEFKQLIADKITEMNLHEAENEEMEFVPLTVEIESTPTVTTESTSESSSEKQVLEKEPQNNNILSEDDDDPIKIKFRRGKIIKDNDDNGPKRLKFRRGKILENDEDDGPTRLKFRRGKILENDEDDGPTRLKFRRGKILEIEDEAGIGRINFKERLVEEVIDDCETERVNLKHQEMQEKKEAQELLNRMIEETASKLEIDRKNKVEALVGAFETVMSLKDDTSSSQ